jgi:hypothetical protein
METEAIIMTMPMILFEFKLFIIIFIFSISLVTARQQQPRHSARKHHDRPLGPQPTISVVISDGRDMNFNQFLLNAEYFIFLWLVRAVPTDKPTCRRFSRLCSDSFR